MNILICKNATNQFICFLRKYNKLYGINIIIDIAELLPLLINPCLPLCVRVTLPGLQIACV